MTVPRLRQTVIELQRLYEQLDIVELDAELAGRAGELAQAHDLRGYDAVHLAAAHRVGDADLVFVAGNRPLPGAAADAGMMTALIG